MPPWKLFLHIPILPQCILHKIPSESQVLGQNLLHIFITLNLLVYALFNCLIWALKVRFLSTVISNDLNLVMISICTPFRKRGRTEYFFLCVITIAVVFKTKKCTQFSLTHVSTSFISPGALDAPPQYYHVLFTSRYHLEKFQALSSPVSRGISNSLIL